MNRGTIAAEVLNSFDTNASSRVYTWINAAIEDIMSRRGFSWAEAKTSAIPLVASQENYVLAGSGTPLLTDFAGIIGVQMTLTSGGVRVNMIGCAPSTFDIYSGPSRVSGVPRFYTTTGGAPDTTAGATRAGGRQEMLVWPVPTAVSGEGTHLLIRYYRSVASVELSADADIPILPAQHHYAIVLGAKLYGYDANGEMASAEAQNAREMYEARIAAMIEEDERIRPIRDRLWSDLVTAPEPQPNDPSVNNPRSRPLASAR